MVDDDEMMLALLRLHLRRVHYEVTTAQSGQAALDLLQSSAFDAVVLDLNMPGMGGLETLTAIRTQWDAATLPILMLTSSSRPTHTVSAITAGANDYLVKPCDPDVLVAKIEVLRRTIQLASGPGQLRALAGHTTDPGNVGVASVCPVCQTAHAGNQKRCPHCKVLQPDGGWEPATRRLDRWIGTTLRGRYFVERMLGEGGSASVYQVRQLDVGRVLAAKIVVVDAPGSNTLNSRERLVLEVQTLARLTSPHVVRVIELLDLGQSACAVIMDFAGGETLDAVLGRLGSLPARDSVEIVSQVGEGLLEIHSANLVHRDVKPANIMLESLPSGRWFARLVDFGVVSNMEPGRGDLLSAGTPGYMAPEVIENRQEVDAGADIYSLGSVLYELNTGCRPFLGSVTEVIVQAVSREAPPLEGPGIPAGLTAVVARMLARDRSLRYPSMQEVLEDLRRV